MKIKKIDIGIIIVMIISLVRIILIYSALPEEIPIHWNLNGEIEGYGNKTMIWFLWALQPFIFIGGLLLPKIDPKKENYQKFQTPYKIIMAMIVVFMVALIEIMLHAVSNPINFNVSTVIPLLIAILFVIIGNYMPKMKHNYTMGIKTPWTLASEIVWDKTHRLAGKLWVIGGLILGVIMLIPMKDVLKFVVLFIVVIVMTLIPTIYSYLLFKKEKI